MITELLREFGLAQNEAKIYETLLTEKETNVSQISLKSNIHRRNVYDSLNRLVEKGLVFQIIGVGDNIYKPVDPRKLMELIQEKKERLEKALPELLSLYQEQPRLEAVYIYKGLEGFKNYLRDLLHSKEDAFFIGAKGGWFDPRLKSFLDTFLKEAKSKKVVYKHLFDHEVSDLAPQVLQAIGKPYKFLPKKYSTPSMIDIYGDRVVTFTGSGIAKISDDITIFVNISRPLATSYKTWFQFMWDMCPSPKAHKYTKK